MSTPRKTIVFGPAYLDRVVRVDGPMIDPAIGGVIDRSVMGRSVPSCGEGKPSIGIIGLPEGLIHVALPDDWPGPFEVVTVGPCGPSGSTRLLRCLDWHDDLGGMGAGFAKALGGTLNLVIGDGSDPTNERIIDLLQTADIEVEPLIVPGRACEWTLLITSGAFGDKLPIGFRAPVATVPYRIDDEPVDLLVAASMTNARVDLALRSRNARVRLFAPAMRNMTDRAPSVSRIAQNVDILCCNRAEWESLDDREEVAWRVSILSVTDGPNGAEIRYTTPTGDAGQLVIPAFPRRHPPRDTNRAGEAFASTLVTTLLDAGWSPGVTSDDMIRVAAARASAASALVLDRLDFGFPSDSEIDRAVMAGIVS